MKQGVVSEPKDESGEGRLGIKSDRLDALNQPHSNRNCPTICSKFCCSKCALAFRIEASAEAAGSSLIFLLSNHEPKRFAAAGVG